MSQAGVNSRPSQKDIKLATRPWSAAGSTSRPFASDNSHTSSRAFRQSAVGPRASSSRAAAGDESFVFGSGSLLPARFVGNAHLRGRQPVIRANDRSVSLHAIEQTS